MAILRTIFRKLAPILAKRNIYITRSLSYKKEAQVLPPNFDYVRFATLGLCYEEITSRKVAGQIAEVGVYKGDFAQRLNQLFPDRKLYLFDTFSGFEESEFDHDLKSGLVKHKQDFSDTSAIAVLARMPYPNNCAVMEGSFPMSANHLDERFCFVSIDVDLYEPCKNALHYFLPRMNKGGFIMIHDYNNSEYLGIRKAVEESKTDFQFNFVPIPDNAGSLIITM